MIQTENNESKNIKTVLCEHLEMLLRRLDGQNERINELNSKLDFNGGFQKEDVEEKTISL